MALPTFDIFQRFIHIVYLRVDVGAFLERNSASGVESPPVGITWVSVFQRRFPEKILRCKARGKQLGTR